MYLRTKNTKKTLEMIESASAIRWHGGVKPTQHLGTLKYLSIDVKDIDWGLMQTCTNEDVVDAETFVKKCAELSPKKD